jgi:hypothetical protein
MRNDNGSAVFATTDLETGQVHQLRKVEGSFPAYEKVIPKGKPKVRIAFNWKLLERLARVVDAVTDDRDHHGIILEIYGPDKAIGVSSWKGSERFRGVLMPLQIKGGGE